MCDTTDISACPAGDPGSAVAAVLVSLYPGVTVLLARVVLHERFSPAHRAGLGLAALAIAAIALN